MRTIETTLYKAMTQSVAKSVYGKIESDIESGVYNNYPVVRAQLRMLSEKLLKIAYVINADELTIQEKTFLGSYGYI